MDIFHYKRNDYLVIIDYYSRWIEIKQLTSLTSDCVSSRVKTVFSTHGIPDVVLSRAVRITETSSSLVRTVHRARPRNHSASTLIGQ